MNCSKCGSELVPVYRVDGYHTPWGCLKCGTAELKTIVCDCGATFQLYVSHTTPSKCDQCTHLGVPDVSVSLNHTMLRKINKGLV